MAKVSEKSTKTDIWEAYQVLLNELQNKPQNVSEDASQLNQMVTALSKAKTTISGNFDAAIEGVAEIQSAYALADADLVKRKSHTIEDLEQAKQSLQAAIDDARKHWETTQADQKLERQREQESYDYELAKNRRDEQEAYSLKRKESEAALQAREDTVKQNEQLLSELQAKVDSFASELETATQKAKEELKKELETRYGAQLKEQSQTHNHEKSLLELKLQTVEAANNGLSKQLVELQKQLDDSSAKLKDMAVAVIRSNAPQTTADKNL